MIIPGRRISWCLCGFVVSHPCIACLDLFAQEWEHRGMRVTLEIPDAIFRRAKAKAAESRIPLRQFVSEAVAEKLDVKSPAGPKARMALAGKLRHLRKETVRISGLIEREFEKIEPEEWA
jgi:hypothetical protein